MYQAQQGSAAAPYERRPGRSHSTQLKMSDRRLRRFSAAWLQMSAEVWEKCTQNKLKAQATDSEEMFSQQTMEAQGSQTSKKNPQLNPVEDLQNLSSHPYNQSQLGGQLYSKSGRGRRSGITSTTQRSDCSQLRADNRRAAVLSNPQASRRRPPFIAARDLALSAALPEPCRLFINDATFWEGLQPPYTSTSWRHFWGGPSPCHGHFSRTPNVMALIPTNLSRSRHSSPHAVMLAV